MQKVRIKLMLFQSIYFDYYKDVIIFYFYIVIFFWKVIVIKEYDFYYLYFLFKFRIFFKVGKEKLKDGNWLQLWYMECRLVILNKRCGKRLVRVVIDIFIKKRKKIVNICSRSCLWFQFFLFCV